MTDHWKPVPVPLGDPRHDIGDDKRAAIAMRLADDFVTMGGLEPEKARQLGMIAAATVRSLLCELGILADALAAPASAPAEKGDGELPPAPYAVTFCKHCGISHSCEGLPVAASPQPEAGWQQFATELFNLVLGNFEWVRAQGGRHSVCPLCHATCERDGGPGHTDDCQRFELARRYDDLRALPPSPATGAGDTK